MSDKFDPRTGRQMHEDRQDEMHEYRQDMVHHEAGERNFGLLASAAVLLALFLIGMVYFGTTSTERQGTQVGQNIERPQANPSVPRDPNRITAPQ